MNVLLAHSNSLRMDPKQQRKMQPYPPLGTLYAASSLRDQHITVSLYDPTFAQVPDEFDAVLREVSPDVFIVCEDVFNFISKMCLSEMRASAIGMLQAARAAGCITIAAGPDMSAHPEVYLDHGADYVVTGEPDVTLSELCRLLTQSDSKAAGLLAGVAVLASDGTVLRNPDRPCELEISRFPLPAWDLVDMQRYRDVWRSTHGKFTLIMASSRGCPYACRWCAKPIWGSHYAQRTPEDTVEEMRLLKSVYAPDHLWFADDIFGFTTDWLARFDSLVHEHCAVIPFTIQTRVDLLSDKAIDHLASAGCKEVWVGAESGSQVILDAMNKGIRLEDIGPVVRRLQNAGLRACLFVQFGYPGETLREIRETIAMIRQVRPDDIGISVCYPLPGAELYEITSRHLGHKTKWTHSDDLAMLFRGAYDTQFYRKLHEVVHLEMNLVQTYSRECTGAFDPLFKEITSLNDAWFELGRLERLSLPPETSDFNDD